MANAKYFLKRFAMALLTIFLVACLTFLLMNAVPGSPWLSEKTPSAATLAALNENMAWISLFMFSFSCILKIFCMVTLACP